MERDWKSWNGKGNHGTGEEIMERDWKSWNGVGPHGTLDLKINQCGIFSLIQW